MVDLDSERSRDRDRDTEESDELEEPVDEWRARASTLRSCRTENTGSHTGADRRANVQGVILGMFGHYAICYWFGSPGML